MYYAGDDKRNYGANRWIDRWVKTNSLKEKNLNVLKLQYSNLKTIIPKNPESFPLANTCECNFNLRLYEI